MPAKTPPPEGACLVYDGFSRDSTHDANEPGSPADLREALILPDPDPEAIDREFICQGAAKGQSVEDPSPVEKPLGIDGSFQRLHQSDFRGASAEG